MSVSQEVFEALIDKIATLEQQVTELENEAAKGVHTCHADCPRPMCVLRRENEALKAELDDYELFGTCDSCGNMSDDLVDAGDYQQCKPCTKLGALKAELDQYKNGHKGGCYACEPERRVLRLRACWGTECQARKGKRRAEV